ncbi:MAG: hypothetical protein ACLQG3_14655 [Terracidiphilus sp.]
MAKTPAKPLEVEVPKKIYKVLKNFLFKNRIYTSPRLAEFTDAEAAPIIARGAIKLKEGK